MMSLQCLDELRRGRQIIATEKLVRWAEEAGFETRRPKGTTHINCRHTIHTDIRFGIVAGSKNIASQRFLYEALTELEKRGAQPISSARDFANAAEETFQTVKRLLPAYLNAEPDFQNGWVVVRDKQLPQIGVTLPFADAHLLENKIHNIIEPMKREAYMLLNRYDIVAGEIDKEGRQTFSHAVYKKLPRLIAEPYRAETNPEDLFAKIAELASAVETRDVEHGIKLMELLSKNFIKATNVVYSSRRGERTNLVTYESAPDKTLRFKFPSFSNGRVMNHNDIHEGRISEETMKSLEARIEGISHARKTQEINTLMLVAS